MKPRPIAVGSEDGYPAKPSGKKQPEGRKKINFPGVMNLMPPNATRRKVKLMDQDRLAHTVPREIALTG